MLIFAIGFNFVSIPSQRDRILVPGMFGAIGLLFGGYAIYQKLRMAKHVAVHENGLRFTDGSAQQTLFWSDVEAVRDFTVKLFVNGAHRHTTRTVTFRGRVSRKIEFSGEPATIDTFTEAAIRHAYDHITPSVLQQLGSGKRVSLGPLWVSSTGIETTREMVEWTNIGDVKLDNGRLKVFQGGVTAPWVDVPLGEIDNYRLLFALMNHFGGVACVP